MTESNRFQAAGAEKCDVRVWADSCQRSEYTSKSDQYLCATCGTIKELDHEMQHDPFPYLSGDKDNMY